jgi:cytochrome P450 family 4
LQEQKDLFGEDKDPLVTYQELQSMKYLELVIKETFRLYPPVPVIGRITRTDMEFDNRVIPKGVNLVLFIYSLHRNPEYFPEPERFDPNRFERYDGSLPYAYIPFSAGSRNCIGQKFAMLELKSVVSTVVRHFELKAAEPHHDLVLDAAAVLTSASGINVGLKKRI